jgi:hypothetical protein
MSSLFICDRIQDRFPAGHSGLFHEAVSFFPSHAVNRMKFGKLLLSQERAIGIIDIGPIRASVR